MIICMQSSFRQCLLTQTVCHKCVKGEHPLFAVAILYLNYLQDLNHPHQHIIATGIYKGCVWHWIYNRDGLVCGRV